MVKGQRGIPVSIHPLFWLFAAFIGWLNSETLVGTFIWIGIIFVSVLFHEFGHALTALFFRQKVRIDLIAFGGVTSYEGKKLPFWQQFLITLNGPLFGFFLFLFASLILTFPSVQADPLLFAIFKWGQVANLFWTVVNLIPVMPLDGGQLLRIALESRFGLKGFKASLLIGALVALLLSLFFFVIQAFLIGAFFFLFAFQSFELWRRGRKATSADREEGLRALMERGEIALAKGDKKGALSLFEQVVARGKGGLIGGVASQYLALLYLEEGRKKDAYLLLLKEIEDLSDPSVCLLHQLAAEEGDHATVRELSSLAYRISPTQEMALRSARAFAESGEGRAAGGWLQSALQYGGIDLHKILEEKEFLKVKGDPEFQRFFEASP